MFRYLLYSGIVLFGLFWSSDSYATCVLSFNGMNPSQYIVVDAENIGSTSFTKMVNVTVENSGSSNCYYFITINEGVSGDISYNRKAKITHVLPGMFQKANSDSISYQLYSQSVTVSNIVKDMGDLAFDQNVLGPRQIKAGQTVFESFLIHVPVQTLPNIIAESYEDDLRLTLYQNATAAIDFVNNCPTCTEESQQPLNLQFAMTDYTTLSLGKGYGPHSTQAVLDFGELETNQQQSFELYVGGRTGSGSACTVSISSENGSKLVHERVVDASKADHMILYNVHANSGIGNPVVSSSIDLSTPNTPVNLATSSVPFICGDNSEGVMSMEVFITIGNTDKKISGVYRDTITVEAIIGL